MAPLEALQLADGRVFTGRQAVASSLVDAIGGIDEAGNGCKTPMASTWTCRPWPLTRKGASHWPLIYCPWGKKRCFVKHLGLTV